MNATRQTGFAIVLGLGCLACVSGQVSGQIDAQRMTGLFHPDSSHEAEQLLRNAAALARAGQQVEAVEVYLLVLQRHSQSMAEMPVSEEARQIGVRLYTDVRNYCEARIAAMSDEARAAYRQRVDPQARRWFEESLPVPGVTRSLRNLEREAFLSSWGDDASQRLGDLAFREGRFAEAIRGYGRIVVDDTLPAGRLVHPDRDTNEALVAAKLLLSQAALGEVAVGPAQVEAYARAYPDAQGTLAGRTGLYHEILAAALGEDNLRAAGDEGHWWPTFAGSVSRTRVVTNPIDVGSFQWKVPLEEVENVQEASNVFLSGRQTQVSPVPGRELAYHPIVVGDQVIACNAHRLFAYNLNERMPTEAQRQAGAEVPVAWDQPLNHVFATRDFRSLPPTPRYTATAQGDRIYARLGPSQGRLGPSTILAVRNNKDVEGKLIWRRSSNEVELPGQQGAAGRAAAAFEGTPAADSRQVYVALSVFGAMTSTYIVCLDGETGQARWTQFVGEATANVDTMMGPLLTDNAGNGLLSLHGSRLYYQSNLGAVIALETETGTVNWVATLPRQKQGKSLPNRDLNPAVAYQDLVIVAPSDASELFAFDAESGQLRWVSPPLPEIRHVLGVAHDRLIGTGNRVWTLDVRSGEVLSYWPQAGTGFEGYGRGLLAGECIYWPTRTAIHVLDQATGLKSDQESIPLEAFGIGGGNLAVGDGYLVIAQADSLVVLCQNRRLIDRYQELISEQPDRAESYLKLARVLEATGDDERALQTLDRARERARPEDQYDGQSLVEAVGQHRHRLLMRLGRTKAQAGAWEDAIRHFELASHAETSRANRLMAILELADALGKGGRPADAIDVLQAVLGDEPSRHQSLRIDASRTIRADLHVAARIQELLSEHGRALYDGYEERARLLLENAIEQRNPHILEELAVSYPASRLIPDALLELGAMYEGMGRPDLATRVYKRLRVRGIDDDMQAMALIEMGRVLEQQGYSVAAREAYVSAGARYGSVRIGNVPGGRLVESLVTERLDGVSGGANERSGLEFPLDRGWEARWAQQSSPLLAEGLPPTGEVARIFLTDLGKLHALGTDDGTGLWSVDLPSSPEWLGFATDQLIAAGPGYVTALEPRSGERSWTYPEAGTVGAGAGPFGPGDAAEAPALGGWRCVENQVLLLRGRAELVALDPESGLVNWTYQAPGGSIDQDYLADPHRVILQLEEPAGLVVLDTRNGRQLGHVNRADSQPFWVQPPLALDDQHLVVVVDEGTIGLLDIEEGRLEWTYMEPSVLPRSGPPRLLGDANCLLVLRDGGELVRLDPLSGEKLWARVIGAEDLSDWLEGLAWDSERVYCANGPVPNLAAYNLEDGSLAWRRSLTGPTGRWRVSLAEGCVLAYPTPPRSTGGPLDYVPLVVCDREAGRMIERIALPTQAEQLSVQIGPSEIVVATQAGGWSLGRGSSTIDGPAEGR